MHDLPNSAVCRKCRYSLQRLPGCVCPECGTVFDPDDPDSYNDSARANEWLLRERRAVLEMLVAPPKVVSTIVIAYLVWRCCISDGSLV